MKRGISVVVTTAIIAAVTLALIATASFYAYSSLELQLEYGEFENAKACMIALAELIESVSASERAAGFVRFATRAGGLWFERSAGRLDVEIDGGELVSLSLPIGLVKYRGGSYVAVPEYQVLRGGVLENTPAWSETVLGPGEESTPLGWVYLEHKGGAWIVLDFGRIRVVELGAFNFSKSGGREYELLGVVEIIYVHLDIGETCGSGLVDVKARNLEISRSFYKFRGSETLSVRACRVGEHGTHCDSECTVHFEGVDGVLAVMTVVRVEVSAGG